MEDHVDILRSIRERTEALLERLDQAESNLAERDRELAETRSRLAEAEERNAELLERLKMIKLAENIELRDADERAALKKKINEYIREIDRCIAWLNS